MKFHTLIILFIFSAQSITALNTNYAFATDTIVLSRNDQNILLYKHKVNKDDKVTELCELFGTETKNVLALNKVENLKSLSGKKEIVIPVSEKSLVTEVGLKYNRQQYLPVVYQVRPKDNLFRIARHYFFQSLDELMARNGMSDYSLSIGEKIHVGWISTAAKETIALELPEPQVLDENAAEATLEFDKIVDGDEEGIAGETLDSTLVEIEEPLIYIADQGKGMWDKKVRDNGKLLALHNSAKIGSIIELKNNMLNRTIQAKVIGRIPNNVYPDDITVLVGPATAKSLGVIDSKFFVEIRYIE